jgi:TRAP-type C4-dicarboxylate transport system substrate-binding protein
MIVVTVLLPFSAAATPISLKLSFFTSDRSFSYLSAVKPFVDAVNSEAKGRLEIQVYFSGALGNDQSKTAQSVLDGTADIAFVVIGLQPPDLFADRALMEMPGLFLDAREGSLVMTRLAAANALKGYDKFHVIGAYGGDPETFHTRPPVAALKDLKGLRIGTNNPMQGAALEKLGMHPVILPVSEFANGVAQNKLDGVAKSVSILFDFGITRLVTHHYMLRASVLPMALLMNRQKFDTLPTDCRDIIGKYSGEWAAARFIEVYDSVEKAAIEKLTSNPRREVISPTPGDLGTAKAVFNSVIAAVAERSPNNRALLGMIDAELSKIRSRP